MQSSGEELTSFGRFAACARLNSAQLHCNPLAAKGSTHQNCRWLPRQAVGQARKLNRGGVDGCISYGHFVRFVP